ncbi:MAG: hypothetical protein AAF697_02410 [Pseudomonadota bacterium]
MARALLPIVLAGLLAAPLTAKDSLGVYGSWAAFRDASPERCYAIAKPQRANEDGPFASIASWPSANIRTQLHIRLSRSVRRDSAVTLRIGEARFELAANGRNAWAQDMRMDAEVVAAVRSATRMSVSGLDERGRVFTDRYDLAGVATAIDAAVVGCA